MKKVLLGLLILVVLVGGGVYYFASNINGIAQDMMETAGSDALGTEVDVGEVDIDLLGGIATIRDFSVDNPEGFSDEDMLHFDELVVAIDIRSLNSDVIRINSIRSSNPSVLYEMRGNSSNLDVVRERLAGGEPEQTVEEQGQPPVLAIDELMITGIAASLMADRLPQRVSVPLGDINLQDMQGTPTEIAQQIARPLITQLSRNAASALLSASAELLSESASERAGEAARQLQEEAGSQLEELGEGVNERVNEAGQELGERLGDMLNQ